MKQARPLLLGHRGLRVRRARLLSNVLRRLPPENSVKAFEVALQQGADGFEFDVRCTADGRGVVCHDPVIEHMRVSQCTFAELQARVPYLVSIDKVLEHFGKRAFLDIELKVSGLETATLELVRHHCAPAGYVVSSFLPEVIENLAKQDSHVELGYIFNLPENAARWHDLPIRWLFPSQPLTSKELIAAAHDDGKKVVPWTINSPRQIRRMIEWGADGLIGDDPASMVRQAALSRRPTPA